VLNLSSVPQDTRESAMSILRAANYHIEKRTEEGKMLRALLRGRLDSLDLSNEIGQLMTSFAGPAPHIPISHHP